MSDLLKWIGIIALVIIGLFLVSSILVPVSGFVLALLWGLAGILAFILKLLFFVALVVAGIAGLILLASWLIRELSD